MSDITEITTEQDAAPTIKFDAVLCRTNAGCVAAAIEYGQAGHKYYLDVSGGLKSLKDFAFAAQDLQNGVATEHPELGAFADWEEVTEYAASNEGIDLRPMVNLINKYGTGAIFAVCANSLDERHSDEADIQIVTAHRSKGLEWDRVLIFNDFPRPKDDDSKIALADLRLAYVAVTRARLYLDCSSIVWMFDPIYGVEGEEE